jgi:hypothetical protein
MLEVSITNDIALQNRLKNTKKLLKSSMKADESSQANLTPHKRIPSSS